MNFFNKFDKLKVKYKDNPGVKISFLLGIISILFIFVGGSYAFIFKSVYTQSINTISAGSLVITLENTTPVISVNNAIPTPDDVALSDSTTYDFTLKNTGSINAKYKLSLINSCTVGNSYTVGDSSVNADVCIPAQYVKAGISKDGEDFKVVKVDSDGNIILDSGLLERSASSSYKLKLWLDYDTPNSYNVKNKNTIMSYKIQLYSEQTTEGKLDTSGANAPELTSNMIPVYYDSTSDSWKKADSNNAKEANKWYDYDNKMWANAVTVVSSSRADDITKNKSVSISNKTIASVPPSTFTSGGYNIDNAKSYTKITVNIKTAGTFGFKATVSSEANWDKLTVTVSKNSGSATTVANAISGNNVSKTYSDAAAVGDVYVITAQYTKDGSGNTYNDNAILDTFTYPANSVVTFTDSATAGGTSGQDWTASGAITGGTGVLVGSSISYNSSTSKYDLKNISLSSVSSSLVGKFVCPTGSDLSCTTPYKIVTASSSITKVDEYKSKTVTRNDLINSKVGTEISMDAINTMWVWVPRYTYTYLNTNTPQEIKIKFEKGTESTGTIKCTDNVTGTSSTSETCTDATNNGLVAGTSTYTHPAFWWDKNDNNVRETGEELTGIWVGKFEVSSDTSCTASNDVAVGSRCNLQTIRPLIKPNVTSWTGAQVGTFFNGIQKMRESGNQYGFATTAETHMMKNMEWGAVTYLSHSKYGINKEVAINSANTLTTGCGPQSAGSTSSGATCNSYTTTLGQSASTTGNVYGVYDMNGGALEYMMGNMVWSNGQQMSGDSTDSRYNSAFTGYLGNDNTSFTGTYAFPSKRYYDKYSYGTRDTEYTRGKLGDATKEMAPVSSDFTSWYGDYVAFPSRSAPWFFRGGVCGSGAKAGAFSYDRFDGHADSSYSARAVLGVLD